MKKSAAIFAQALPLVPLSRTSLQSFTSCRPGEVKIGETMRLLSGEKLEGGCDITQFKNDLQKAKRNGSRFAVLGIPEDVGPRANLGRGGANSGWNSFLPWFSNMQHVSNQFEGESVMMLGHVRCEDLQSEADNFQSDNADEKTKVLRQLVERLDARVESVVKEVFDAGLELVVIGGGHNNCLPIIRGASSSVSSPIAVCNLDPHGDIRLTHEGRHSGNGFSTALEEGSLGHYYLCGYHRRANSEVAQQLMANSAQISGSCFDDWMDEDVGQGFSRSLNEAIAFFDSDGIHSARGIEVDLDAIAFMPTSAASPSGVTVEDARRYVRRLASKQENVKYLHLAEGAPSIGGHDGDRVVGKTLAYLVCDYIESRMKQTPLET